MKGAIVFFTSVWGGGWLLHTFGQEAFPGAPILITACVLGIHGAWMAIDELSRGKNK